MPVTGEPFPQERQGAVVAGFHGRLPHVECVPNLLEAQLPETAQLDDRPKPLRQGKNGLLLQSTQVEELCHFLR